ncbi:MAG: recombinase RecT [Patescibacteria group bacterium]
MAISQEMSPERWSLLKRTYAKDGTDDEFWMYLNFCKARGVSLASQEIYFSKFGGKVCFLTSYHNILAKCQETGQFEGMTQALFCGPDGVWKELWTEEKPPFACKIGVFRKVFREACWTIRYYSEAVQPNPQWKKQPLQMLRKCAIADALRLAFDDVLRGIYITEEMPMAQAAMAKVSEPREPPPTPVLPDPSSEKWEFEDVPDCYLPPDLQGKKLSFERLAVDETLFYASQGKQTKARAVIHRWATGQNWPEALREIGEKLLEKYPKKYQPQTASELLERLAPKDAEAQSELQASLQEIPPASLLAGMPTQSQD